MTFDIYIIRSISLDDIPQFFDFVNSNKERIANYFPTTLSSTSNLESTSMYILERVRQANNKEFITFVVEDTTTSKMMGVLFIKDINWNCAKAELAFFIDKNYERKGIITKSISYIIDYCFRELKLNKVFMRIAQENFASRRVAEKNDFKVEGILRQDFKTFAGELIDVIYYGLLTNTYKI